MTITEEDFKKMFDLVRELHQNYTKNIERENEMLRNALAEAQQKLDEAVATIEKLKEGGMNDEALKKWKEIQDKMYENTKIWTSPAISPHTYPNYPGHTWYTTNTTQPYAMGGTASSGTASNQPMKKAYEDFLQQYTTAKLHAKADEDG
jgi:hypothetical protein